MPVASGVVNRFDSVMTSLCGLPLAPLTSRKPSPPAPPDLLITTTDCFDSACLLMMPCITRAIWSAPPPVPAGTMISIGWLGSHAAAGAGDSARTPAHAAAPTLKILAKADINIPPLAVFLARPVLMPAPGIACKTQFSAPHSIMLAKFKHKQRVNFRTPCLHSQS